MPVAETILDVAGDAISRLQILQKMKCRYDGIAIIASTTILRTDFLQKLLVNFIEAAILEETVLRLVGKLLPGLFELL